MLLTQTAGLSNLVNTYLDVWLAVEDGDERRWAPVDRALLIDDPTSARIRPETSATRQQVDSDPELEELLGLDDPGEQINSLLGEPFTAFDLLPILVIGSVPAAQMAIAKFVMTLSLRRC